MKFTFYLFLLFCFPCTVFAKADISKLLTKLQQSKNDSEKALIYRDITNYYKISHSDSGIFYAKEGLRSFTKNGYTTGIGMMLNFLSEVYELQGRSDTAEILNNRALAIFKELKNKEHIAITLTVSGIIEGDRSDLKAATKYFIDALNIFKELGMQERVASAYIKLGSVNDRMGNIEKALEYYNIADDMAEKGKAFPNDIINLDNNIGIIYGKKGDFKKAMGYFEDGLRKCNTTENIHVRTLLLMNLGIAYQNLNDNTSAEKYYREALDVATENNIVEPRAHVLINLASVISDKDMNTAMAYLKEALQIGMQAGLVQLEIEAYQSIVDAYKQQGNYKEALASMEIAQHLTDSISSIKRTKEIANLQSSFDLKESKTKVQLLEKINSRNILIRNIIIAVVIILAILLVSMAYSYRKTIHLNEQLRNREKELSDSNTVKDQLFSIIGHDLRGPISSIPMMLDFYLDSTTTPEEKEFLFNSLQEHVQASMATLDKLLYWGQYQIKGIFIYQTNFHTKEHINSILKLLKNAAVQKKIEVNDLTPDDINLHADVTQFDFILRNMLSNAIKYTYPNGIVEINANKNRQEGFVVFSVRDNGVGMTEDQLQNIFKPLNMSEKGTADEKGTSLGLMLCKEFIIKNGGEIWVESEKGIGTTFYFSLKSA
ncbi:MAG: tetratricopeptide repeat-containing sensor histidine kinase [Bacteroidota bacterium]